jgi:hypothetical protein
MEWIPQAGDRVRSVISKDNINEIVYLNADHVIESVISNEFLIQTSEHIPWSHQIIDYLSRQRGMDRELCLRLLIEFNREYSELDFDQLCLLFLEKYTLKQQNTVSFGG